jgi:IS30 family transposase
MGIHGVSRGEPMAQDVDQKQLRKLLAEKLPQREMARRLNIARSTLQRMIKGMDAPASSQASASSSGNGLTGRRHG